ncbi:MAG: Nif3-like dinuclear metal center hexameric protein [Firmicutes bacterium]|nr:Nif3-like dinuclear metal center hexameric protein [Bacillota bacterium]
MLTVQDVAAFLEKLAPLELASDWDNVGLQIGRPLKKISTVLVTLTLTNPVFQEALDSGSDLIVAHHPLIFNPLKAIRTDDYHGKMIASLLEHDLALYVSHTNLDQAPKGLNHWLAQALGLKDVTVLVPGDDSERSGLGRVGTIAPISVGQMADQLRKLWRTSVRVVGDKKQIINKVAVVGGSGGDLSGVAKAAGADLLITGDVSYHHALDAQSLGLAVIDAGHFATEKIMVRKVAEYLRNYFGPDLDVMEAAGRDPFA